MNPYVDTTHDVKGQHTSSGWTNLRTHPVWMRLPSWTGWVSRGGKSSVGASRWRHTHASYCRAPWEARDVHHHTASSMVLAGKVRKGRICIGNVVSVSFSCHRLWCTDRLLSDSSAVSSLNQAIDYLQLHASGKESCATYCYNSHKEVQEAML